MAASPVRPFDPAGARPQPAHRQPQRGGPPPRQAPAKQAPAKPEKPPKPPHERGATALKWLHRAFEREVALAMQDGSSMRGELVGFDDYTIALLLDDGMLTLVNKGAVASYTCPALRLSEQELAARRAARGGAAAEEEKKEA